MTGIVHRSCSFAANLFIAIGAFGLVLMTAIIGWQVFGRYVLEDSPDWSEPAALALMIWYVSFAAAAGVREGFHIRITALQDALPSGLRRLLYRFCDVVVGMCGVVMLIWGIELVIGTWQHKVPGLGLSRGMVYLCLPIAGALIAIFALERLSGDVPDADTVSED